MKNIILLIIIFLSSVYVEAQKINFAVSNNHGDFVYMGIGNNLTIIAENTPADSLYITTDNGRIYKSKKFEYFYAPTKYGIATITLKTIKGLDTILIGKYEFRVISPELTIETIGEKGCIQNGLIDRDAFKDASYISVGYKTFLLQGVEFKIYEYCILVIRNNKVFDMKRFENPFFNDEAKKMFASLKSGDIMIFNSINYITPDGKKDFLNPLEYRIK
ncbi:MAG: hypothetical protein WCK02_00400 [Bacteroidota bacterium]